MFWRVAWLSTSLWGIALLLSAAPSQPFRFADDFSAYPAGSVGEPNWDVDHIGFSVRNGVLRAEVPAGRGIMWLRVAPLARRAVLETTVVVHQSLGEGWKIAGIGFYLDNRNFWHLALVEAPKEQDKRHFAELIEMLDGVWLANYEPATRLTTEEDTGGFDWHYNRAYRLRLTLEPQRIVGEIVDLTTNERVYRCARRFDNRAVTVGRPMLTCGGFLASFDDVRVEVSETVPEPKGQPKTYPPFVSRPSPLVPRLKGTGFFRIVRLGETWWLVDPNGYLTLSVGTDHVNYFVHWCEKLGYAPYHRFVARKYGSEEAWAKEAVRRLLSWNFNVLGANNSLKARYQGLVHTEFISFGADFASVADIVPKVHWTGFPDVFDPRFERFCDLRARERCAPNKDDPWLLGYFLDNELEWWGKSGRPWGMAEEAWKKPPDRACKQAFVRLLREFYRNDISAFNADFGTNFASFDELLSSTEPAQPRTQRGQQALMVFVAEAAERYFRITAQAIKKHDPNHLNLGCRFAWDVPEVVWRAAGKYCDIVTVNTYPRIDLERGVIIGLEEHLRRRYEWCQKPMIITEWSFPALDAKDSEGRPLPCKHGAGMRVDTQEQKARCYTIFQRTVFALPFIVGSHYFMWVDEPALGIASTFPEDSNYGLVSEADEPYPELTAMATKVNAQAIALHSGQTPELSVVRESMQFLVSNTGKATAVFTLSIWVNGNRLDERVTLRPNASRLISLARFAQQVSPSEATYLRVACDPEDEVLEPNEANNWAEAVLPPKNPPKGFSPSTRPLCLIVANPTDQPLKDFPVTVSDPSLQRFFLGAPKLHLKNIRLWQVKGAEVVPVPFQTAGNAETLSLQVSELPPYGAVTFWLGVRQGEASPVRQETPFTVRQEGTRYEVTTGVLRLVKDEPDGDAFDRIYWRVEKQGMGDAWIELGSFTPLIFQVVGGQNLWVHPDRVEQVEVVEQGPARLVMDITFAFGLGRGRGDKGRVITEVGEKGQFAPLQAQPQPFRCAYRFTFFPHQPFFLSQCLWVENTGQQAWQWRGYYHYALSRIGGDANDDEVGGANVPNYWLFFASWRDPKLRVHYGIIPLQADERLSIWFWKDEGDGQHPDCHRRLEMVLQPKERWEPKEPEPIVAVFGAQETEGKPRPWSELVRTLRAWAKVKVTLIGQQ